MIAEALKSSSLTQADGLFTGRFEAMRCGCEILLDTDDADLARELLEVAEGEARRVENKFSRYLKFNIIGQINASEGRPVRVDDETAALLDFAGHAHKLSRGLFDITSGILRKAWVFDGSDRVPSPNAVRQFLPFVGWRKLTWDRPFLTLPAGMEIDLGGIGKEYAVDRSVSLLRNRSGIAALVNFGGDLAAAGKRRKGDPWTVGIEGHTAGATVQLLQLKTGALATSGDSKKFLLKDGRRFGHILNPFTGYPAEGSPRSVTVAAATCTEAGFLSTVGMLMGKNAKAFLNSAETRYWCVR